MDALRTSGGQDCGDGCGTFKVFYEGNTVPGAEGSMHYDKTVGCKSSNLVYGMWCTRCRKVVYEGRVELLFTYT